jgi:CelD/BcsL family acetyltransferase involved in cellulose biosynthesis
MLTLDPFDPTAGDWARMDAFPDRQVFQTREWLAFVAETQRARPVVAAVNDGSTTVGYFTGLLVRRFGISILGSPMPGWTTSYMGFNLQEGVPRRAAVEALLNFAWAELGCRHLELHDRRLLPGDVDGLGFDHTLSLTYELDLSVDEDELFARMTSACRRALRKADKVGVTIEEAHDLEFADDYHAQLREVFARQGRVPTYPAERVTQLIRHLEPTGRLLLLRARDAEGRCVATGIFPAMNTTMVFWGGASWREQQHLRPNEAVFWYAMRYWKRAGIPVCDLGGGGDYKRKYGVTEARIPFVRTSRPRVLSQARGAAKHAFALRRRVAAQMNGLRGRARQS